MHAGVLPFAKRGDNRTNNLIRLQQMFPRIVAAEYHTPSHVSTHCRDLLSRMLTADPAARITINQVSVSHWHIAFGLHAMLNAAVSQLIEPYTLPRLPILCSARSL